MAVWATVEITRTGLLALLASGQAAVVADPADVVLVAAPRWSPEVAARLLWMAAHDGPPALLMVDELTPDQLVTAVHHRVVGVLSRDTATAAKLARSVHAAASGGGVLPPDLVGSVLEHVRELHHELLAARGLTDSGLSPREIDILRMLGEGHNTAEIASKLGVSERTVKSDLAQVTGRLGLRTRAQAIAYAVRVGVI